MAFSTPTSFLQGPDSCRGISVSCVVKKQEYQFYGIPECILVPKTVSERFPLVNRLIDEYGAEAIEVTSGFQSGTIQDVKTWESLVRQFSGLAGFSEILQGWTPEILQAWTPAVCAKNAGLLLPFTEKKQGRYRMSRPGNAPNSQRTKAGTQLRVLSFLRTTPITPNRPVPNNNMLAGSGIGSPGTPTSLPPLPASPGTF